MLMPKRVKYRKQHRGNRAGTESRGVEISFGEYGLQALEPCWISARQIEAARRAIVRHMRRRGRYWVRIFPDKPITAKPAETRMGKGKGDVDYWASVVRPGRVMFEISGVPDDVAHEALRLAAHKLPIRTQIIARIEQTGAGE